MTNQKKFYVTTPIYYATAAPHLGTLYSTVLADIAARWHKVQGVDTYFLTGTDEFGQKIADAAAKVNKNPKEFVDGFIDAYKDLWKLYGIDYSIFMRTTNEFHVKAVQDWLQVLIDKGDIYKGTYEGWYCTSCETFLTEKDIEKGQQNPPCISCARSTNLVSEECYFFRLSNYADKLLAFYKEHPEFITPKERAAEVIKFVESGLQDLSISRTTISWGVPFPGDAKHVTYVWADALNNYITAIGYGQKDKQAEFKKWWPADMQVMGKDIVRFHAIYWPAFLMATGLPLPKQLLVHGWIKVGDQKMSKSLGNSVNPVELYNAYGADQVRYYLARQFAITQDGQFSCEDLEHKINTDLANDLGNLLQRMVMLADKYKITLVNAPTEWHKAEQELYAQALETISLYEQEMALGFFHRALAHVWKFLNHANAYFQAQEPWKMGKGDQEGFLRVMSAICHSLQTVAVLVWPVMPQKMVLLAERIGYDLTQKIDHVAVIKNAWNYSFTLSLGNTLFEKHEVKKEELVDEIKKNLDPSPSLRSALDDEGGKASIEQAAKVGPEQASEKYITIDDLVKVQLRVGQIVEAELVEGSEKLLRLQVDFGDFGKKQIFSGVRKSYQPEDLLQKQAVFVVNLKPRKMMGQESCGMMMCAQDEQGNPRFVGPTVVVPNGTVLQ